MKHLDSTITINQITGLDSDNKFVSEYLILPMPKNQPTRIVVNKYEDVQGATLGDSLRQNLAHVTNFCEYTPDCVMGFVLSESYNIKKEIKDDQATHSLAKIVMVGGLALGAGVLAGQFFGHLQSNWWYLLSIPSLGVGSFSGLSKKGCLESLKTLTKEYNNYEFLREVPVEFRTFIDGFPLAVKTQEEINEEGLGEKNPSAKKYITEMVNGKLLGLYGTNKYYHLQSGEGVARRFLARTGIFD